MPLYTSNNDAMADWIWTHKRHPQVYLDGEKLDYCVECHTGEGWALVYITDENGMVTVDVNKAATKRLTGEVELR